MKLLVFFSLYISQFAFALSITDFVSDFATGDAAKLCSKLAKLDQPKCNEFIKDKGFRKEFLSVCFKAHEKMGAEISMSCLEAIANKTAPAASRTQAETCEELVSSKNSDWVLNCVKSNVTEEFAKICSRYVDGGKAYKSAVKCVETLGDYTNEDLDMAHVRGGCMSIKDKTNFSENMASCLVNAEAKKSAITGRTPKIQEKVNSEAQQ